MMIADPETVQASPQSSLETGVEPAAGPEELIIIPVRDVVLLPGTVTPITIGREVSVAAAQQAVREERQVGILMQRDPKLDEPTAIDLHRMGAVANILRYISAPDGTHHIVLQG